MRNTILFLVLVGQVAFASDLELTPSFEGLAVGGGYGARSTLINPANTVLGIPDWTTNIDLRPSLDAAYRDWRVILRPRYLGSVSRVTSNGNKSQSTSSQVRVDEAYLRWEASGSLNLTAGILNFQWGPAELLGPSNPLVHFHSDERSILYRPRGKVLARAVYSFTSDLTAVLLVEPINNGEPLFIADQSFTPRALLKLEKRFSNAADYFGVTLGRADEGQAFVGEYGNLYLNDLFSLYADARETLGSTAFYPNGGTITQSQSNDGKPYFLATAGLRYEGFVDVRLEYIFNSYGLTQPELMAVTSVLYQHPALVARGLQSGRELAQQHYFYASIRSDKLLGGDALRAAVRYIFSPGDQSGSLLANIEWAMTDHLTAIAQPVVYHGGPTSEFGQGPSWELLAGLRVAF